MATKQRSDDDFDDDIETFDDDNDIDPFLDVMEKEDTRRGKGISSRRKIEALQEKLRLKKLLEDYPDNDFDFDYD